MLPLFSCSQIMRELAPMTMKCMYYPGTTFTDTGEAARLAAATQPTPTYLRVDSSGALLVSGGGGLSAGDSTNLGLIKDNTAAMAAAAADVTPAATMQDISRVSNNGVQLTPKYAIISAATSGATNTIVAAVATKKIRVLSYSFVCDAAVGVQWRSSTAGSNLSGIMSFSANGGIHAAHSPVGHFETAAGESLNFNLTGNVGVRGHVTYVEV